MRSPSHTPIQTMWTARRGPIWCYPMRYPNICHAEHLIAHGKEDMSRLPNGRWVAARALGFASWRHRWHAAWLVFTGRADALVWEGQ
jgi:hypothetical protein